jgi:hypothetical protein
MQGNATQAMLEYIVAAHQRRRCPRGAQNAAYRTFTTGCEPAFLTRFRSEAAQTGMLLGASRQV